MHLCWFITFRNVQRLVVLFIHTQTSSRNTSENKSWVNHHWWPNNHGVRLPIGREKWPMERLTLKMIYKSKLIFRGVVNYHLSYFVSDEILKLIGAHSLDYVTWVLPHNILRKANQKFDCSGGLSCISKYDFNKDDLSTVLIKQVMWLIYRFGDVGGRGHQWDMALVHVVGRWLLVWLKNISTHVGQTIWSEIGISIFFQNLVSIYISFFA